MIPEEDLYAKIDESFSLGTATVIGIALTPIISVIVLGLYCLIWGGTSLLTATMYFRHLEIVLPIIFISIFIHEGLHWLGYVGFAHLPWKTVHLGFNLRYVAPYVHADSPVTASAYKRLVALPGVILGVIPALVGIAGESGLMTLYGLIMLLGAVGDLTILWKIRRVSADSLVIDHPTRAGCWVLTERVDS